MPSIRLVSPEELININASGYRQHALLSLVRMHYVRGEIVAARKVGVSFLDV
jgi:hypothetical protein